ncbi:MAG: hypothetical protein IJF78_03380 [Clostridia bacterium]|nr:hypothetical protein [Clostridia bacterium]
MKKTVCILMGLLFLTGCGGADRKARLDVPTVLRDAEGECLVEIPQIMDSECEEALAINAEVQELAQTMQDTYWEDDVMWCEMTAWPTETERYLSLTVAVSEYPTYGANGQLMSWVYDKDKGTRVLLDDALAMADTDMEQITADIRVWCGQNDYEMSGEVPDFLTFRMLENGVPQFMTGVSITPGGLVGEVDPWSSFFTWTDGTVEWPAYAPFDPAEITGTYSHFLFCQTYEDMGQYEGDAAVISEEEAMLLFEEIYEINKYLEDGYTMRFDGNTVEIDYQTCICAVLEKDGAEEGYYAATWGSAYWYDPEGDAWIAVGFG